jgi:hypothetical protein
MMLDDVVRTSTIIVHPQRYAYLKASGAVSGEHFLVTRDQDEVTVVTTESKVSDVSQISEEKWFALCEIRVSMPFVAKGFLAKVTRTIADVNLNVLVVSTFSKDYILVRDESRDIATDALRRAGFPVEIGTQ